MQPQPREPDDVLANHALHTLCPEYANAPEEDEVAPPSNRPLSKPLAATDVFVDDFVQLAQGGPRRMKAIRRHLWNAVDETLAKPDVADTKRNEAISLSKLEKGDGAWTTRKTVLGWILDTLRQTLELPAHRKVELAGLLSSLCKARRISKKRYERALGKLRFVASAIPGTAGLFSVLQDSLNTSSDGRIKVT